MQEIPQSAQSAVAQMLQSGWLTEDERNALMAAPTSGSEEDARDYLATVVEVFTSYELRVDAALRAHQLNQPS